MIFTLATLTVASVAAVVLDGVFELIAEPPGSVGEAFSAILTAVAEAMLAEVDAILSPA